MARKVILDVDPGVDDCLAICLALADPRLEVVAITAVAGNVNGEQATRNVQAILDRIDPARWPRTGAALAEDTLNVDRRHLNGDDGLSGSHFEISELHHRHASDKVICDEVRSAPGEVSIFALGPLTNIAAALQRDPNLADQIGHLIIRGGTLSGPGDVTASAEFNFYCNSQAAQSVVRSPVTKTLVPLDLTHQVMLTYDMLDQIPSTSTKTGSLLRQILPPAFRAHRQHLGLEGIPIDDTVALISMINENLVETSEFHVDVETAGELTLGASIIDQRQTTDQIPNAEVVVSCDTEGIMQGLLSGLLRGE